MTVFVGSGTDCYLHLVSHHLTLHKKKKKKRGFSTYTGAELDVLVSLSHAVRELDLVVAEDVGHDHLDLVDGEEAAGAGVAAVAEGQVGGANADELAVSNDLGGLGAGLGGVLGLAQLVVAEGVENFGVGEDLVVEVDAAGGDFDDVVWGDDLAVGELDGLEDLALEGAWGVVSEFWGGVF